MEMPKMLAKVIETFSNEQTLMVRDCAIIYILYDIGIRASELCGLTLDNVYLQPDDAYLKVLGKGDKWREVGLGKEARIALHRYISGYRKVGPTERYVFISRQGNPLTINGLEQLTYRLGRWARVKGVRCSPHTFRHTFAVNYLQATGDIYKLSRIMGHSSVKVTEGYLKSVKNKEIRNSIFVADTL